MANSYRFFFYKINFIYKLLTFSQTVYKIKYTFIKKEKTKNIYTPANIPKMNNKHISACGHE